MIDGRVSLTLNMSFSNSTGEMVLTTRDNPTIFSLISKCELVLKDVL